MYKHPIISKRWPWILRSDVMAIIRYSFLCSSTVLALKLWAPTAWWVVILPALLLLYHLGTAVRDVWYTYRCRSNIVHVRDPLIFHNTSGVKKETQHINYLVNLVDSDFITKYHSLIVKMHTVLKEPMPLFSKVFRYAVDVCISSSIYNRGSSFIVYDTEHYPGVSKVAISSNFNDVEFKDHLMYALLHLWLYETNPHRTVVKRHQVIAEVLEQSFRVMQYIVDSKPMTLVWEEFNAV